jgi:hypothetical protein
MRNCTLPIHVAAERGAGAFPVAVFALLVGLVGGCSSFEQSWRQMAEAPPVNDEVLGRWEGRWASEATGHGDVLRCIITKQADGAYDAWFRARFMKVFNGEYHAALEATRHGDHWRLSAAADLGFLAGGVYRQEGQIRDGLYSTTYQSE